MLRETYHMYIYPVSPEKQAEHFLKTVGNFEAYDLPPIVDVEGYSIGHRTVIKAQFIKDLLQFMEIVENTTKRRPMVYTNIPFANHYMLTRRFAKYPLWISLYEKYESPHLPKAWESAGWAFWQKSDSDNVEGIQTHVDFDTFNGNSDDLINYIKESNIDIE